MKEKDTLWFVFDIDGVITSGTIVTDGGTAVQKSVNLKDIDAIYELNKIGCRIAAVSAEKDRFTQWVQSRFPWDAFYDGIQDKGTLLAQMRRQIHNGKLIYIGDGKKDLDAFSEADVSICPEDAILDVRCRVDIVLHGRAGTGILWELVCLAKRWRAQSSCQARPVPESGSLWAASVQRHQEILDHMLEPEVAQRICGAAEMIWNALQADRKLIFFGNGGSAADAQHIAAEFVGKFNRERAAWNAIALTTNVSVMTAVANDFDYGQIFARQISAIVQKGDVVIGISTSGRSENVISGLREAQSREAHTILLTGMEGQNEAAELNICVLSQYTPGIQEMHLLIGHFWVEYCETKLGALAQGERVF